MTFQELCNKTPFYVAYREGWVAAGCFILAPVKIEFNGVDAPALFELIKKDGSINENWIPSKWDIDAKDWEVVA